MPYSIQQQLNTDLDIFLFDGEKVIHIASAGGLLPGKIAETDIEFRSQLQNVFRYRRIFNTIQIENLERNNITSIEFYLDFFKIMSKRGFFSYDKLNIDDVEDQTYQLISYPLYDRNLYIAEYNSIIEANQRLKYDLSVNIKMIRTNKVFPNNFNPFNLNDYL